MGVVFSTLSAALSGDASAFFHLATSSVTALVLAYLLVRPKPFQAKKRLPVPKQPDDMDGALDTRRKAQIAWSKPTDHAGEVVMQPCACFDMQKTIFGSLEGVVPRLVLRDRLGVEPYWADNLVARVEHDFRSIPAAPHYDRALVEFMHEDCNFAMEHADGSFMDHLRFCYEYSHAHFKQHSPRVLLLHSIMGVGTNFFPMEVAKEPKLKGLLTDAEFTHIEAFPSLLRLINHRRLLAELCALSADKVKSLKSITFHRVIDNQKATMSAQELWVQLNYQLIHLLDFLPASNWADNMDDAFLLNFVPLHDFLTKHGLKEAKVDFDLREAKSGSQGRPLTLGLLVSSLLPSKLARNIPVKAIAGFSAKIGHSLDFQLQW